MPANTGSDKSFIHSCLPKGIQPNLDRSINVSTLTGEQKANRSVVMRGITLPEFFSTKKVDELLALVYDHESAYDMIIGNDFYYQSDSISYYQSAPWNGMIPSCLGNQFPISMILLMKAWPTKHIASSSNRILKIHRWNIPVVFFANAGKIKESLHEAQLRKWCNNKHTWMTCNAPQCIEPWNIFKRSSMASPLTKISF